MLNRVSIEAALPVAEKLKERGIRLLPKDGTPMMSLLLSCNRSGFDLGIAENADLVGLVSERSKEVAHGLAMTDLVKVASECVSRTLDNARNVVLPHIKLLVEQVTGSVEGRRQSATSPYEIVMKEIPAAFTNQGIIGMAERYGVRDLTYPPAKVINIMVLDDIVAHAKTGMAGSDADLANLLSLNNNEGYAQVMDVLAGRKGFGDMDFDYAPGLMVVAQAIYDEPGEGVKLGLHDYNAALNAVIHAAAAMTLTRAANFKRSRELGLLYVPERTSITQVIVMGEAYRKLLDDGLSPEVLIGNEMAGRKYTAGQLIENASGLKSIYDREMNLRALRTQSEMFGICRNVIDTAVRMEIAKLDADSVDTDILRTRLSAEIDKLTEAKCGDLYQALTDIVCNVFYPESDARSVIMIINRVGAQFGGDGDPREIALLATIKYVNNWIASQLCIATA